MPSLFRAIAEASLGIADSLHFIILLPLLSALVIGLLGRWLSRPNVHLLACASVFGGFIISVMALAVVMSDGNQLVREFAWHWFSVGDIPIEMAFRIDRLSAMLSCVVTGVGFLIHLFSTEYMSHDEGYARYFAYLNLFVAMMSTLVLGANLLVMFVGWEGVGLASYLLIGFWYRDDAKAFAGRKAFIVNRIGDFGFLLGIFMLMALFGTIDFEELRLASTTLNLTGNASGVLSGLSMTTAITITLLLLFVGATGKSAQIPLYVWLPDAMAGPTPVSALIHAATMVTAGVYMIARMSFLYVYSPTAMAVVALIGVSTAVFAALMAYTQNDIKKVLAYSTVSQLGFMFIGVGVGAFWAGIFHLVTHAFFKAALFLGAGAVMHGMRDETDIRKFGGLRHEMPHTFYTFLIGTIAITGVLPLSGFFSKDAILHAVHSNPNPTFSWLPSVVYYLGLFAALSTSFYMWRMCLMTFFGERRTMKDHHAHDGGFALNAPLWILAGLTVGATVWGLFPSPAHPRFEAALKPVFATAEANLSRVVAASPHESSVLAGFVIAWLTAMVGFAIAYALYLGPMKHVPREIAQRFPALYQAFYNKFYIDEFYDAVFVRPLKGMSRFLYQVVDSLAIDKLLVNGTAYMTSAISHVIVLFQNGNAQRYAAVMTIALVGILYLVFA